MARNSESFSEELSAAVRAMTVERGTQNTLDEAVRAVRDIIDACDAACISIVHKTGIDTPAGTDEAVRVVDELQFELQEGPCYDAIRSGEVMHAPDLATDERWPVWGPKIVQELGLRSSVSYRLFVTDVATGALNLYSRSLHGFGAEDRDQGLVLAAHVAVAVSAAMNVAHLETAVIGRTVIGQAQGILMERFGITADVAFRVLVRLSSTSNMKLLHVAEELVRTRIVPE